MIIFILNLKIILTKNFDFFCFIIFINKYYQILLKIFNSKLLLLNILYYFLKFIL